MITKTVKTKKERLFFSPTFVYTHNGIILSNKKRTNYVAICLSLSGILLNKRNLTQNSAKGTIPFI